MFSKTICATAFFTVGVICNLPGTAVPADMPGASAAEEYLTCVRTLARDPKYGDIASKLPLAHPNEISFSMLADESRPTAQERNEIAEWFDEREQCWTVAQKALQTQWPPELVQLSSEGNSASKAIGVDLYNRKLSYGEANKQLEELGNSIKARVIPIVKQYQAEMAAQKAADEREAAQRQEASDRRSAQVEARNDAIAAQAEVNKQQRMRMFLNYMQATRPPAVQFYAPPGQHVTNCTTNGNNTSCVSP